MSRLSERIRFIVAELACLPRVLGPQISPVPNNVCVGLGKLEVRNSWRLGFRVQNSAETRLEVLNFAARVNVN